MQVVSRLPNEVPSARIQPLAVLPVFLDLQGKRAIVAGGTDAAAWKAELLAAAGANVQVFAADVSDEMLRIAECETRIELRRRPWEPGDLQDAAVAVADADDESEAAAFEAAARRAGAACNVIDKPAYCGFQFGSIVNRSPVVVGISTSGAAPILGQAIRRRIETLLPPALASWAQLARDLRDRVAEGLVPGPRRRALWEALVDRAFGPEPTADDVRDLNEHITIVPCSMRAGHVTFVGAGPGDAGLMTLKGVRAMQAADVILFDDLVADDVLELARREAKRILVGKRAGRPSCKQHEINAMMVSLAKAGRHVVRLKSGDPMIFGRGGEEIEELERQGIGYDVVPGVTAALAMAASLGVSLTHRDKARSVRFMTGHSKDGGLPKDVDWKTVADPSASTIFYMGGRTATAIADILIGHGLSPSTAVVVCADISRKTESKLHCSLAELQTAIGTIGGDQAVLIGVGSVFAKRAFAALQRPESQLAVNG